MPQTGRNYIVAFKEQAALGTRATQADATRLRHIGSPGLNEEREPINSEESRPDLQQQQGRLGTRSVSGSYEVEGSLGSHDEPMQAVMRGTWDKPDDLTQADLGALTVEGSTLTFATGDALASGIRVGDVIRLSGTDTADNDDRNLRVTGVTATTVTVAESLTTQGAGGDFTLWIARRLVNPSEIVRRVFTVEQRFLDIDASEIYEDVRFTSLGLNAGPNAMKRITIGAMGRGMEILEGAESPHFTAPTAPTSIPLTGADAVIRFGGEDVAVLTSLEVTLDTNASNTPVIGADKSPDVYDNLLGVTAQASMIRRDLENLKRFGAEDELELHAVYYEPGSEPRNFLSIFMGNVKISGASKQLGGDGPMIETVPLMVGVKPAAPGYEETTVKFATSYEPA